jgi:thiol-disulfide isomerase/thioredoxin
VLPIHPQAVVQQIVGVVIHVSLDGSALTLCVRRIVPPVPSRVYPCSFAPWCGKCKTIRKEYERAAQLVHDLGINARIARLDANAHAEFAVRYEVENVPTFYLFRNHSEYREAFPMLTTAEAFAAGLDKMLGGGLDITPAKVFHEGALDIAQWLFWRGTDDGKVVTTLVLYNPIAGRPESAGAVAAFDATAKELMRFSNLRFGIVNDLEPIQEFELNTEHPTIVLYKDHDEGRVEYDGVLTGEALAEWMLRQDIPLVTDVWHRTLQMHRKRVPTLGLFYLTEKQFEHHPTLTRVTEGLQQVAFELEQKGYFSRGEFTIGIANGEKYSPWMRHFGLERFPSLSIENTTSTQEFTVPDFSEEASRNLPGPMESENGQLFQQYKPAAFLNIEAEVEVQPDGEVDESEIVERIVWVDIPVQTLIAHFEAYFKGELAPIAKSASESE